MALKVLGYVESVGYSFALTASVLYGCSAAVACTLVLFHGLRMGILWDSIGAIKIRIGLWGATVV